ncbi:pentatricopeptide repeat-containing protein At2g20540-like [Cryptomeria japonica]|uniref:pentatricopeptide repeat-containing protein At2g20540-like n=1 Tax=Cryptomeria japonica TaxID=3369 RepID=UPI0027D9F2DA|nr:pentatricopeptide repeat-containing protein At2g20540-like [Cryptomeria japonica]
MLVPSTTHLSITALCREGQLKEALHILLTTHNPPEDSFTYLQLLQTCILKNALSQGVRVHSFVAHRRFAFAARTTFHNKLINMYAKCGRLVGARKVFDNMKERDSISWNTVIAAYRRHGNLVTWNAMIAGYAQTGYIEEALETFEQMRLAGLKANSTTFSCILTACAKMGALEQDMYAKCGSIEKARLLFDKMPQRDVISWTAMVAGYAQHGFVEKALETFKQMRLAGVKPDSTTFVSILPACAKMGALEQAMQV